jgi:hypothetical protein
VAEAAVQDPDQPVREGDEGALVCVAGGPPLVENMRAPGLVLSAQNGQLQVPTSVHPLSTCAATCSGAAAVMGKRRRARAAATLASSHRHPTVCDPMSCTRDSSGTARPC